ncbi:MAG: S8 family serine peptidase, partial [Parvibaculaceae bacterium]
MRKPQWRASLLSALLALLLLASDFHMPAAAQTPLEGLPNQLLELPPFSFIAPRERHRSRTTRPPRPARAAQLPPRIPDELIAAGLTDPNIATLETEGYQVISKSFLGSTLRPLARLRMPRGTRIEDARRRVAELSADATVDSNHFYRLQEGRCEGRNCRSLASVAWPGKGSKCKSLPLIGMIDTAVNIHHPALKGQKIELMKLDRARPLSDLAHGTAIASQLVAGARSRVPGLLPNASLIAIDAFENVKGVGLRMQAFDLMRALDILLARKVAIVNMSFAGPDNRLLLELVNAALRRDVLLVASVGNAGPRGQAAYPAAYQG